MQNINIINSTAADLKDLVKNSALTVEGLATKSIPDFVAWIENHTPLKNRNVYVTSGKLVNSEWNLHGRNAYSDDLNLVSVKLDDMEDFNKIIMPRFDVGGRWMDDIHDNNVRRERNR